MMIRVGLDFDNTIACYDAAFCECAKTLSFIPTGKTLPKQEIKRAIMNQPQGEHKWQRVQGQVYGKYIGFATMFPGLSEFLWQSRSAGVDIFVVSHKTDFGHFDEERINLRDAARDWMTSQGFFSPDKFAIHPERIFFEYTRESKVRRINELQLDFFIDDLIEVLSEPTFTPHTKKILFGPAGLNDRQTLVNMQAFETWPEITEAILRPGAGQI